MVRPLPTRRPRHLALATGYEARIERERHPPTRRPVRLALVTLLAALAASGGLTACHGDPAPHPAYMCPMECEGDQSYDQPGRCPVCGMELVEVAR